MILQSAGWAQEGSWIWQMTSFPAWLFQASRSWFLLQKSFPMNCEAQFWFPPQFCKKTTQLVRNSGVSHSFLGSNCYPPLSLWSAGFSKSWGNRWPWLYPVEQRTEHRFHRSKRAGRVRKIISFSIHPSPNTTNHPVSWEISLLQSLWVILVLANKDKDGEKRHPDKSTVPFCLTNFYCYNF